MKTITQVQVSIPTEVVPHLRNPSRFSLVSHAIRELTPLLLIPDAVITTDRDRILDEKMLCLVHFRLAYPSRWVCAQFARTAGPLSRMFLCHVHGA